MFGAKSHIGLDIGTTAIRAVEAENKNNQTVITKIGVSTPPAGTIADGKVAKPDDLTKAIRKAIEDGNFKSKRVYFTINPLNVIIRYLELPLMTDDEAREAIKWELSRNIPFTGKAVYDFQVLNKDSGIMNVMLVAVEENIVENYCACIKNAGLIPAVVDIEPLAMARLIERLPRIGEHDKGLRREWDQNTVMLVDLGDQYTSLSFFQKKSLSFHRVIPFGGQEITNILSPERYDFAINGAAEVRSVLLKLVQEIKRSTKFYRLENRNDEISGMILAGGLAQLKGLDKFLAEELSMAVEVLNPFPAFRTLPEVQAKIDTYGPALSLGLGLAIREAKT